MAKVEFPSHLGNLELACLVGNLRLAFAFRIFEVGLQQFARSPGDFQVARRHLEMDAYRLQALSFHIFNVMDPPRSSAKTERDAEDDRQQDNGNLSTAKPALPGAVLGTELVPKLS
jgi:hypothetical protein